MANQHSITDNPPAFARPCGMHEDGQNSSQEGMTLRDYFAAAALSNVAGRHNLDLLSIAEECYQLADAMLTVRERGFIKPKQEL